MPEQTEAQKKAHKNYIAKYEDLRVRVPRGRKSAIQAHAEARSESVNSFINRAIAETMERDSAASAAAEGRIEGGEAGE